ncbi:unnamed protein product [Cladocopium goreaui]|uniref:Rhomboid-like protease n=1 Tax=Cladocopium goreaui TaxID=2562237 RepID=A0A9P1GT94_9DINO|nr:unnamed protein product [Cladocopium goreaui]
MPPMPAAMLPPGLQEEEPFAALIFPGFDSSAFIWQITCWQAEGTPGATKPRRHMIMAGLIG